tara:strand:+ start:1331 stop:2353 length:1023 start_codon:yes stop_codon:yes gene_type:complete
MSLAQGTDFGDGTTDHPLLADLKKEAGKCNALWRQIQTEAIESGQRRSKISNLLGKWVNTGAVMLGGGVGPIMYVNDYGYSTAIAMPDQPRSARCPTDIETYNDTQEPYILSAVEDRTNLLRNSMTPCRVAGKNVINSDTGEVAWVGIKGSKHIYSKSVWLEKSSQCAISPINVTQLEWDALQTGPPMTKVSPCLKMDIDPKLLDKYNKAQARLEVLIKKCKKYLQSLEVKDAVLNSATALIANESNRRAAEQAGMVGQIEDYNVKKTSLNGELQTSSLSLVSNHMRMLVWLFISLATIGLAIAALVAGPSRIGDFVLVTLCLVVVYWLSVLLYRYRHGY